MPIETFTYHLKAHKISNKLVSKVSAQKKGGKSYDSYKYVFKFRRFQVESPQIHTCSILKGISYRHSQSISNGSCYHFNTDLEITVFFTNLNHKQKQQKELQQTNAQTNKEKVSELKPKQKTVTEILYPHLLTFRKDKLGNAVFDWRKLQRQLAD